MENMVDVALKKLNQYCRKSEYKGWDLYDGLNSKLLSVLPVRHSKFVRLGWIQLIKRSPINLRRILLVPKGYNPKGLALFASGLIVQGDIRNAGKLLSLLDKMSCVKYGRGCWGYNFAWQARAFYVPIGTPNLVTTVFVANAYLDMFEATGDNSYLETARQSCTFILNNLILREDSNTLVFRYVPNAETVVHNAYMLGAALLARTYRYSADPIYLEKSRKAIANAIRALSPEFSWPYGERFHHQFVDNFHTGFNLVALNTWSEATQDRTWDTELAGAYDYWRKTFFLQNGCPRYYSNSTYPIDVHCSAQGIVTCLALRRLNAESINLAKKIAEWTIENMQSTSGAFYYQKTKWFTNKISYIRWSQAWMFYALSQLAAAIGGKQRLK